MVATTYNKLNLLRTVIAPNYALPVDAKAVGRNLRAVRKARKETQEQVAARMDVVQEQISEWERGKYKSFDMETLFRLAKGYGITLEQLVVGVDREYDATHRDLARHADLGSFSAADSQPQREVEHGRPIGAASSRVQSVDPVLIKALENAARALGKALARARGERVSQKNA